MGKLENMLNIGSCILVFGCPIIIGIKVYLQLQYEDSIEKTIDRLKGYEGNYMKGSLTLFLFFLMSLIYLIA
jgi:hypothetical protein